MSEFWGFDPVDTEGQIVVCLDDPDDSDCFAPMALELRRLGVPVWYDYGLKAGEKDWAEQVISHIRKSNAVVFYISDWYMFFEIESFAMWEYHIAKSLGKPIIPVFSCEWFFEDDFIQAWSEEAPKAFKKHSADFDILINSDYVRCSDDDPPQSTAAAIEELLRKKSLYAPVLFVDDPAENKRKADVTVKRSLRETIAVAARGRLRETKILTKSERDELRAAKKAEHRYTTASRRWRGFRNNMIEALVVLVMALVVNLCFNPSFREYCVDPLTHSSSEQPVTYTAEQADEVFGVSEPLHIYPDDDRLFSVNLELEKYIVTVTVDHYGFFKDNIGNDCILIVLDYTYNESLSESSRERGSTVLIPKATQDGKNLYYMQYLYSDYNLNLQPETRFIGFKGVDLNGGDISVSLLRPASDSDAYDEYTFVCPMAGAAVGRISE